MFLALTLSLVAHGGAAPDLLGPPAVCQPFDIGDAQSLPWKKGAFGIDPDFDLADLNLELARILDADQDTLVHMESLRRAVVYVTGFDRRQGKPGLAARKLAAERLISMLRARALAPYMGQQPVAEESTAPALFDLGFALAALDQIDWKHALGSHFGDGGNELERALAWSDADAAMHLGAALGLWVRADDQRSCDRYFLRAARLAGADGGLVASNIMVCARRFHGVESYEELVTLLTKRIAAS